MSTSIHQPKTNLFQNGFMVYSKGQVFLNGTEMLRTEMTFDQEV